MSTGTKKLINQTTQEDKRQKAGAAIQREWELYILWRVLKNEAFFKCEHTRKNANELYFCCVFSCLCIINVNRQIVASINATCRKQAEQTTFCRKKSHLFVFILKPFSFFHSIHPKHLFIFLRFDWWDASSTSSCALVMCCYFMLSFPHICSVEGNLQRSFFQWYRKLFFFGFSNAFCVCVCVFF